MTSETCETLAQKIMSSQSSTTHHSSQLNPTISRDSKVMSGIDTEFVDSKKIETQFRIPMQTVPSINLLEVPNLISVSNVPSGSVHLLFSISH